MVRKVVRPANTSVRTVVPWPLRSNCRCNIGVVSSCWDFVELEGLGQEAFQDAHGAVESVRVDDGGRRAGCGQRGDCAALGDASGAQRDERVDVRSGQRDVLSKRAWGVVKEDTALLAVQGKGGNQQAEAGWALLRAQGLGDGYS